MAISRFRMGVVLTMCLLVTGSMGMLAYHYFETEYRRNLEADIRLEMQPLHEDMQLELGRISSSLSFLVDQVEQHIPVNDPESKYHLAQDFLSFVRAAHNYGQIRLIDMSGMEVIRANLNNGNPALATASELQNKSHRYYVQEGLKLERGQVYLSPFDLNIEHGKIELPIKPTIRLVQPAFDAKGQPVGLVVVNVLGNQLLEYIDRQSKIIPVESISLLNQDGYWLAGPDKEDLWAFMYADRKERSFAQRQPAIWQQIQAAEQARVEASGGVFLSDSFYPARVFDMTGLHVDKAGDPVWKLVIYYTNAAVTAALATQGRWVVIASLVSGVVLAIILLGILRLRRQLELRRAAEALAREQALENEKSQAIVTIAGGIAHEFNNILACIFGSTYLLRENMGSESQQSRQINIIEEQGERGAQLVRHLMAFARIDHQQVAPLSFNELLAELVSLWRQSLPKHIDLEVTITEIPLRLQADESKLTAALQHLFNNAVDAEAETTAAKIRLSLAEESPEELSQTEKTQRYACLTLRDNGCGIAPDNLSRIFDPFFTTKEPWAGTGMGLALVYGVVQAMDGEIRVESTLKVGTTFRLYLPLISEGDRKSSPQGKQASPSAPYFAETAS